MEIQDRLFSEVSEERYYSVLMTEDEYQLYKIFSGKDKEEEDDDVDEYEGLNYTDLLANRIDKNPLTIKKLRKAKKEHLSKEKGKGRLTSSIRAAVPAAYAAAGGATLGAMKGGTAGAILGGAAGAVAGGAGGYAADRAARRLRNKIRKSGGGGIIDDTYAREYDRLDTLDKGGMTKEEFKKKWYRNKEAK